jgi:hypothetical protein
MHLEGKRLTAKYRASKMFLPPFFWLKSWTELDLIRQKSYESSRI